MGPDLQTHLDAGLVGVSVAVAILASYAALDLTRRSSGSSMLRKRAWLAAGGVTMGIGIWSMHFVGMLSLRMGMPVSYNGGLVIASLAAAVIGASVSLAVVTRPQVSRRGVLSAAAFMGFAVAAMHYLGMASMQMAATIHWQLALVVLSVAIGLVASLIALALLVRIGVSSDGFGVYEQLVLDRDPVGLLAVGWHRDVRRLADRTLTLLSMVAAEAAVALDRENLLAKLEHLARRDELTGVLNRRALGEELDRAVATATRHHRPLSIVMLDLDHFKSYNDTHGHQAGDRLLKHAAAAWTAALRTSDLIARYGGEEFLIILPDCALNDAIAVADRLRTATPSHATCSAGVAVLDGDSAAQLIGRADHALYEAKNSGRNRTSATRHATPTTTG